jgi:hypothetical protein
MQSFAELLVLWPSLSVIGRELDVPYDTVIAWKRRSSVPYEYWPALVASAIQHEIPGITMETLADALEELRRQRREVRRKKRAKRPNLHRQPRHALAV